MYNNDIMYNNTPSHKLTARHIIPPSSPHPLHSYARCTQEPVLFALSLRENIAYGLPNDRVSEEEVIAAAKAANAHEFIEKLPQVRPEQ